MEEKKYKKGMSIYSVLTLILIVLKAVGVIDWRWVIVLMPLLAGFLFKLLSWLVTITVIMYKRRIRK